MPNAQDYTSALVATPRGGYLISGDAYNSTTSGFEHIVLETDSLGVFRRSRLIQPLGPGYNSGSRASYQCNVLVLPNAQGYLLSGTADSTRQFSSLAKVGYVMRLDTALRVQWVYRHPAALAGTGARSNYAYRIRYLSNNTVGLLLTDVRNTGTPDAFLVQLDIATGQRIGTLYTLSSNTQAVVIPYEWQWVGDGTLLLCGRSSQVGVTYLQSYVARWDFRNTPLAARSPQEAMAMATFYATPVPAAGPLTLHWHLPPGQHAGAVRLYSILGQLVRTVPLPPTGEGQQEISGLPAGLYLARLTDADGHGQGGTVRLVVQE